jgi:hypothetical protein
MILFEPPLMVEAGACALLPGWVAPSNPPPPMNAPAPLAML